jgi:hypothetical protein
MRQIARVFVCLAVVLSATIFTGCNAEMLNTTVSEAGRIILNNQVSPSDSSSFGFEMSYGPQVAYPDGLVMGNGQQVDSGFILKPGTYTINESVPEGWQLTININDPSGGSSSSGSQSTIDLAIGETVIVTYINTKVLPTSSPTTTSNETMGRIILKTQVNPGGAGGAFDFTMSYGRQVGYPNGAMLDALYPEIDSGFTLSPGMYTISETVPAGWQLIIDINDPTGGSFSSGSQSTIDLAAGETIVVTYINTKILPTSSPTSTPAGNAGRIVLKKHVVPVGTGGTFDFTMSYGQQAGYPNGGKLGTSNPEIDSGFALSPGMYTISETVPAGWQLTIDINDPSGGSSWSGSQATIDLAVGETVIVTYTNTKTSISPTLTPGPTYTGSPGRIILRKQIVTTSGGGPFFFTMSYGSQVGYPNGVNLDASHPEIDSGFILNPGIYSINETVPPGWTLTIDISDPSGGSSSTGSLVTIDLAPGETVIVTYTNTKTG